ncbi:MAG: CBS domain-containing protein [Myxococcales bacterium]|nr:CBS domain-containing protein [Myxococcales bacterium]
MTTKLAVLREEDNLASILEDMESRHIRHLPVVDGDKLVGLITHRDLLRLSAAEIDPSKMVQARIEQRLQDKFVASVMTRDVATISPDTTIREAATKLVRNRFGCFPVVEADGTLVGIVTEHDLLEYLARSL